MTARGQGRGPQDGGNVMLNDGVPKEVEDVTVVQRLGEKLPLDLEMVDSDGQAVRLGELCDGTRPLLVTLNYSDCPMLCSVHLNGLVQGLQSLKLKLGEDFRILTLSIDPKETTKKVSETKQKYVDLLPGQPGAGDGWTFCTAEEPEIKRLAEAVGFQYTYDQQSGEYYHPAMMAYVSPDGVIVRYSLDVAFPEDQLRLSILDAGQGKVGSPVDQFIMWCFSYDATRNSYVLQAWRLMRLGGFVTIVLLVGALLPYWVGRKNRSELKAQTEDQMSATES